MKLPEEGSVAKREKFADGAEFSIIGVLDEELMFDFCVVEFDVFCSPYLST